MAETATRGAAAAAQLRATADEIVSTVRTLPVELIHWVPGENVWTVMDNLCHIREFVPFWTGQTVKITTSPDQLWGRDQTDTARLAAVTHTSRHELRDVLRDVEEEADAAATTLATLTDAQLAVQATSKNTRWGVKPASFVLDDLIVAHVAKHLGQIRRNVVQFHARVNGAPLLFPAPLRPVLHVTGRNEVVALNRIFCVGRNYEAHAREMGGTVDRDVPFYFTKSAQHYVASGSTVPYPAGTSNYHYEMEFVAVIGRPAFNVTSDRALDYVFGYACGLDMTRRDLQVAAREQRRPWDIGKDVEQSAVIGAIMPAERSGHVRQAAIELRVNGATKQHSDISSLIHGVPEIVAHLSTLYHLQPGDVIFTGTPEGVGPVSPGDRLEGTVAGVGEVSLTIGAAL